MTGPLGIPDALVLSPMVDVTDAAFRSLAREGGADITCSEMVAAAGLVHHNPASWALTRPWPGESPYGVQLMGGEADLVAAAARAVAERVRPDFIDINLGCPSPNILRSEAGGFLLRDPKNVGRVVAATVAAVDPIPVSIKLRMGPAADRLTYLDVCAEAEAAGAAWCTLHGRTVEQGYQGHADWNPIARLVEHVRMPVVGNGDLRTPDDVLRMKAETGCHGFFIARAAMHDPTVFRRMRQALDGQAPDPAPPLAERLPLALEYLDRAARAGGLHIATARRQAMRFIAGAPGAKRLRKDLHDVPDVAGVRAVLREAAASFEVPALDDEQRQPEEQGRVP